jgi:hypothetical protein
MRQRPHPAVAAAAAAIAGPALALAALSPAARAQPDTVHHGWHVIRVVGGKNSALDAAVAPAGGPGWIGGSSSGATPVLYHAAGTWPVTHLAGNAGAFVQSLSATSRTNVWAALENEPAVAYLTSHGWRTHSIAIGSDDLLESGVVTFSPKDTWVFAFDFTAQKSYAWHDTRAGWKRTVVPYEIDAFSNVGEVSGSSDGNIWAIGGTAGVSGSLRFNGKTWQAISFPAGIVPSGQVAQPKEILAESPSNVWATVYTAAGKRAGPVVLLHWDGTRWREVTGKNVPDDVLTGPIASDGAGGLWLAAENPAYTRPLLLHYTGRGTWATDQVPADGGKPVEITALASGPGSRDLLATAIVGAGGFGASTSSAVLAYTP